MTWIFESQIRQTVEAYIDDIVVKSKKNLGLVWIFGSQVLGKLTFMKIG